MRILCVVNDSPWPLRHGFNIRLSHVLAGLGELGTVDVLLRSPEQPEAPDSSAFSAPWLGRVEHVERARRSFRRKRLRWYFGRLPRDLLRDAPNPSQLTGGEWDNREYDLVWFGHIEPYLALGAAFTHTARVVDIDNLDDWALRHRLAVTPWEHEADRPSAVDRLRIWRRNLLDRIDGRRLAALQRRIAAEVDAVTVCSELDRDRLAVPNCFVVPNAYEVDPTKPATAHGSRRSAGPVVTMVALYRYAPNTDGATCLAEGVLPLLRARCPEAEVRFVGRTDGKLDHFADRPGVVIRGEVPDVGQELLATDVVAVPIRFGGGTRIKVLEAFARRLPVVTTAVGVEGLDVRDGEHVLIADDAASFASACARLFEDRALAKHLTDAAYEHWAKSYRSVDVRDAVAIVADAVVDHRRSTG